MATALAFSLAARAAGDGCPADPPSDRDIDPNFCDTVDASKKQKCEQTCKPGLDKWKTAVDQAKTDISTCRAKNATCSVQGGGSTQLSTQDAKKTAAGNAAQCTKEKATLAKSVAKAEKDVCKELDACKSFSGGEDFKKKCDDAAKEAKGTGADDDKKAKDMDNQKDKADENAKKEGGGMPQMPQIPQMPQNQDSQPDTSTATNPNITSDTSTGTAGATESSKLDGGSFASPGVGFGSSGTATSTSTTTDSPGFTTPTNAPVNMAGLLSHDSPLGSTGTGGGFGSFGSAGGGGAAGGGGSQNTTGASAPGPTGSASSTDSPYEVSGGGGGKLGAPKGFKSGGESDSAIADAAKGDFKADVGDAARNPAGDTVAQAGDEESDGFTVFKMIHSRYIEIKKRGAL